MNALVFFLFSEITIFKKLNFIRIIIVYFLLFLGKVITLIFFSRPQAVVDKPVAPATSAEERQLKREIQKLQTKIDLDADKTL